MARIPSETKAHQVERLKRGKNAWEHLDEICGFFGGAAAAAVQHDEPTAPPHGLGD